MSPRPPPRYLPTLTEVVQPRAPMAPMDVANGWVGPLPAAVDWAPPHPPDPPSPPVAEHAVWHPATPDRQALAQQLVSLVRPQLEAELRTLAQQHFDAQFSAWLPSLQQQIEAAVRAALDHTLPEQTTQRE